MKISPNPKNQPSFELPARDFPSGAARYLAVGLLFAMTMVTGCGRPATEAECREILRRSVELELRSQGSDKSLIESEIKTLEESMKPAMMKKCVGKRITESALTCVRKATTSKELLDDCLR